MAQPARIFDLQAWRDRTPETAEPTWSLTHLAGRLVELSAEHGSASLTIAFGMVLEAQQQSESVAWVMSPKSSFYPPDVAESGIDLDALAVVRIDDTRKLARVADHLVRCGAFGLVVVDVDGPAVVSMPMQSRLLGLAQKHQTAVVFLTRKGNEAPSLGSLISLRAESRTVQEGTDRFTCELTIVKDKRRSPGWTHRESCRGPAGLH